ncbi:MAG TPA: SUMF1/EgtB/PvdO family nonheme iron enzyme [Pirellulales bacterium]|nr:SUMF1/EgtB/PvdO family nonheme iron enzyme [Pirellulales bacterium]
MTKGQFRQFVEADDYRTDAETDGKGGMGWSENDQKFERKPEYTWQSWGVEQPDDHPVVNVTFNDAMAYCAWLSKKEGKTYRLPTEAQWEYACRAGSDTRFYHGDDPEGLVKFGNVADATLKEKFSGADTIQAKDGYVFTAPVGWFRANKFGLYDMAGNAMEWCSDWYDREFYGVSPAEDPQGSDAGSERVIRGGAWIDVPVFVRSTHRRAGDPATHRLSNLGFRVVLDLEQAAAPVAARTPAADGEPDDERPEDKVIAVETITNTLGMKLALVPSGRFTMGSDESPADLQQAFGKLPDFLPPELIAGEGPAHPVKITKPFYMGVYEVTRGEFRQFVEADDYKTEAEKDGQGGFGWSEEDKEFGQKLEYTWRSVGFEQADDHPVVNVSFNDAQAFCAWLSAKERKTYRLPTEAEWEYACRAGSNTRFYNGNAPERTVRIGNVADATAKAKFTWWKSTTKAKDGFAFTAPVGQFRRNQFGLYDMTGNTWEWCSDWFDMEYYGKSPPDDPTGPTTGTFRVIRGGAWLYMPVACRSAMRNGALPVGLNSSTGFRVVLDVEPGSAHEREETPPLGPKAK